MFMFLGGNKAVQVKLVGDTLVAAFRHSNPNLIWKFDLERNHSFTLALQGEDGDLELGVTSAKGEFYPVARFASRDDAEEAFTAVQKILMRRRHGKLKDFLMWVCGVLLALLLATLVVKYITVNFPVSHSTPAAFGSVKMRNGVPLPADQVLRPPP